MSGPHDDRAYPYPQQLADLAAEPTDEELAATLPPPRRPPLVMRHPVRGWWYLDHDGKYSLTAALSTALDRAGWDVATARRREAQR